MIVLGDKLWEEKNRLDSIRIQELENRQLPLLNKYKDCKYIVRNDIVDRYTAIQFYKIKDWELETNGITGYGKGYMFFQETDLFTMNYKDDTFIFIKPIDTDYTIISEAQFNRYFDNWTRLKEFSNSIFKEFTNE